MPQPDFRGEDVCPGRNHPQRFGGPYLQGPTAATPRLLITGPVADGFWVRTHHVMALARWAASKTHGARRLPLRVVHNSSSDAYYDAAVMGANAWDYYFEPVDHAPHGTPTFECVPGGLTHSCASRV